MSKERVRGKEGEVKEEGWNEEERVARFEKKWMQVKRKESEVEK